MLATPACVSLLHEHGRRAGRFARTPDGRKEKPRYDGTWRPEPGKVLPPVPEGVAPVLALRNPKDGG